jgi:hypothetical protein
MGIVHLVRNKTNDKRYVGLTAAPLHTRWTLDGVVLRIVKSAKQAASEISGSESKISDCCRGGRKTHKGCMWCYSSPQKGE